MGREFTESNSKHPIFGGRKLMVHLMDFKFQDCTSLIKILTDAIEIIYVRASSAANFSHKLCYCIYLKRHAQNMYNKQEPLKQNIQRTLR